jgi:pSer/pThr/pTyr-binding forkhead associated (FHA) protein
MKVQLVVVRGKPEGKVIPLVGPNFKIGRGETCHLRPSSEQISREHAEFSISGGVVEVRDLGSRNGTLVNGKALTSEACKLKDRDLVQVGPLTFAVSIMDAPVASVPKPVAATPQPKAPVKSLDDVSGDEIDSWLLGDGTGSGADRPTAVFGGDTITISAFKDTPPAVAAPKPAHSEAGTAPPKPPSVSDDEYERQEDEEEEPQDEDEVDEILGQGDDDKSEQDEEEESDDDPAEELIDESNPFYAAKKAQKLAANSTAGPAKQAYKDTSDAANDILRKLMEKRRANR